VKPIELCRKIKEDLGVDIVPSQLRHWESFNLLGDIARNKKGRREYTEENLKKAKIVVVLKLMLHLNNNNIIAWFQGNDNIKREVMGRLEIATTLLPNIKELLADFDRIIGVAEKA